MSDDISPVKHFSARSTTYKGVRMRSRLEAAYAEQFDAFGWRWEYEPQCFASSAGQYLPDFRLTLNADIADEFGPAHTYVEVKPNTGYAGVTDAAAAMPRWWSIISESDPAAVAFILAFGADRDRSIYWLGMTANMHRIHVCPAIYGHTVRRVSVCSDADAGAFCLPLIGPPTPVTSLYADTFLMPTQRREDDFALRIGGC